MHTLIKTAQANAACVDAYDVDADKFYIEGEIDKSDKSDADKVSEADSIAIDADFVGAYVNATTLSTPHSST